jgi:hypothetical protein
MSALEIPFPSGQAVRVRFPELHDPIMTRSIHTVTGPLLAGFLDSQGAVRESCERLQPKKVAYRFMADLRLHGWWLGRPRFCW